MCMPNVIWVDYTNRRHGTGQRCSGPPARFGLRPILPARCSAVKCLDCRGLPHAEASLAVDWRCRHKPVLTGFGWTAPIAGCLGACSCRIAPDWSGYAEVSGGRCCEQVEVGREDRCDHVEHCNPINGPTIGRTTILLVVVDAGELLGTRFSTIRSSSSAAPSVTGTCFVSPRRDRPTTGEGKRPAAPRQDLPSLGTSI